MKIAVLISGRGSNLQSLAQACKDPETAAEIVLVVSNNPQALGLKIAAQAGLPTTVIDHRDFTDRVDFEQALHAALTKAEVELICLAGFMRLLTAGFIKMWQQRIINIHPSLLPAFKGLETHHRVIKAGVRFTGATVHYVSAEMDEGPILVQAVVPVLPDDTPERLAKRVLTAEHQIYPHALRLIATGKVHLDQPLAPITGVTWPRTTLIAPLLDCPAEPNPESKT